MNHYTDPNFPRPRGRAPRNAVPMQLSEIDSSPSEGRAGLSREIVPTNLESIDLNLHSSINRWALAGGLAASAAAAAILLSEPLTIFVQKGENTFNLDHGLTVSLLAVTTILGHLTAKSAQARRFGACAAFTTLFIFGTGLTIFNSASRQSLGEERAVLEAATTNDDYKTNKRRLDSNNEMLSSALTEMKEACKKGLTDRCKARQTTVAVYEDAALGIEAKLRGLKPQVSTTKAQQFSKLLSDLHINIPATIISAIVPFALSLFFELTSIACYINVRKKTFQ